MVGPGGPVSGFPAFGIVGPSGWMVVAIVLGAGVGLGTLRLAPDPAGAFDPSHVFTNTTSPVSNFTASIDRLVELVSLAGSGILALVWARVAFSWFSNDITKKVQAKDRARDALFGTLLFVAAITGLIWGLAHWVLTGS